MFWYTGYIGNLSFGPMNVAYCQIDGEGVHDG